MAAEGSGGPTAHIVDGHGEALRHWQALPGGGYSVLHVDSHADMFLDFEPAALPAGAASPAEVAKELDRQVHLSNFIPLGILGGKVDRVVWLRSDFPSCRYNGPPPGEYKLGIGPPDSDGGRGPALCYWQHHGRSFHEYNFMPDPLRGGYEIVSERTDWPPREKNCWWEKVPYLLDDFGLYLLGEPMGTPYAPPVTGLERTFDLSVVTDSQLHAEGGAGARFLGGQLGDAPWILDIDLDFFSTLAPALAPVVRRLGLGSDAANSLGEGSQVLAAAVEVIEQESPSCQAFRLPLLQETMARLLDLGSEVTGAEVAATIQEMDARCCPDAEPVQRIAAVLQGLSAADRASWSELLPEEWDVAVESPHGPHFVASRESVAQAVERLERVLSGLVEKQGLQMPATVTVARSTDLYLPLNIGRFIEEQLLAALRRLGWAGVAVEPAPPWPAGAI